MDWKAPKSVRQIGDTKGKTKIYVEDYVMSFARRLSKERKDTELGGVLLGHRFYHAREKVFLVSGMVSIQDFQKRSSDTFTQEMWTGIYTDIKENFTDLDVVGWYYSTQNASKEHWDKLSEIHRRNFADGDKLLYTYDEGGGADQFHLYENGSFKCQNGYYIYYEKNPEMRKYMMEEANRLVHIVEQEDDRVIRNIRGVIREKEERKKEKETEGRWTYGLASMVVILGLILGGVALNNQNGLTELKQQMENIQTAVQGENTDKTTVETIGSGVVSQPAVAVVSGAAVSPAAVTSDPGTQATQATQAVQNPSLVQPVETPVSDGDF